MTFRDICAKLKTGEMTFDPCGHPLSSHYHERFIERFDEMVANEGGANDGKWNSLKDGEDPAETNARMREFYSKKLNHDVAEDESLEWCIENEECRGCGIQLKWVLNGNRLTLRSYFAGDDFKLYAPDYLCRFAVPKPTTGEIAVSSKLIFANFFRLIEDCDKKDEHTPPWSLSHASGREKITAYKAERNVAYGQMGNMSVGIFLHPDRKSIIVGDQYVAERLMEDMTEDQIEQADHEALSVIDGHKLVGSIILDVWRWEATDFNTLGAAEYKKVKKENKNRGLVEVEVEHGVWKFEHFYDTSTSPNESIYARLTLK